MGGDGSEENRRKEKPGLRDKKREKREEVSLRRRGEEKWRREKVQWT